MLGVCWCLVVVTLVDGWWLVVSDQMFVIDWWSLDVICWSMVGIGWLLLLVGCVGGWLLLIVGWWSVVGWWSLGVDV